MLALFPNRNMGVVTLVNAGHELPVPGNPALTDQIARNVVHAALVEPIPDAPTLGALYLGFDLVSLLLVVLAAVGVARAISAVRNGHSAKHPALAVVGILLRVVGVAALLLVPGLLSGWAAVWTWHQTWPSSGWPGPAVGHHRGPTVHPDHATTDRAIGRGQFVTSREDPVLWVQTRPGPSLEENRTRWAASRLPKCPDLKRQSDERTGSGRVDVGEHPNRGGGRGPWSRQGD